MQKNVLCCCKASLPQAPLSLLKPRLHPCHTRQRWVAAVHLRKVPPILIATRVSEFLLSRSSLISVFSISITLSQKTGQVGKFFQEEGDGCCVAGYRIKTPANLSKNADFLCKNEKSSCVCTYRTSCDMIHTYETLWFFGHQPTNQPLFFGQRTMATSALLHQPPPHRHPLPEYPPPSKRTRSVGKDPNSSTSRNGAPSPLRCGCSQWSKYTSPPRPRPVHRP